MIQVASSSQAPDANEERGQNHIARISLGVSEHLTA